VFLRSASNPAIEGKLTPGNLTISEHFLSSQKKHEKEKKVGKSLFGKGKPVRFWSQLT